MAKITNRFVHFKTKASFTQRLGQGDIQESSVVFIQDANEIWTHGTYYHSNVTWNFEQITSDSTYALTCRNSVQVGDNIQADGLKGIITDITYEDEDYTNVSSLFFLVYMANLFIYMPLNWDTASGKFIEGSESYITVTQNNLQDSVRTYVGATAITEKKLDNLPSATNTVIAATDSILSAFAKLQGQVNAKANTSSIPTAATVAPKASGTAAVGTSTKYAREDHVHPLQTTVSGNAGTATKWATSRTITVTGGQINGSVTLDGSEDVNLPLSIYDNSHHHNNSTIDSLDASKITSGTIDIARLPKGALERLFVVASQSAAVTLVTSKEAQEGDTVQITGENNTMYFVVDATKTTFADIFREYTAGAATSVPWSGVTNKPTILSLGETSTTAYAGDKGALNRSMLTSLGNFLVTGAVTAPTTTATTATIKFKQIGRSSNTSAFGAESTESSYVTIPAATTTAAGLMSATDKVKLNSAVTGGPYLPTTGGTISQNLTIASGYDSKIILNNTDDETYHQQIVFQDKGTQYGALGTYGNVNIAWNGAALATQAWVTSQNYIPNTVTATATTLAAGASATVVYDKATNKFTFGIPRGATGATGSTGAQGPKGDKGDTGATGPAGTYTAGSGISISGNTISAEIPIALPNPYALTINGQSYTGSSSVNITTAKILSVSTLSTNVISAGYNYNNSSISTVATLSGFSASNPDTVIVSSVKMSWSAAKFNSSTANVLVMDGITDLSGSTYIYCVSYMANGKVAVNGAVYA